MADTIVRNCPYCGRKCEHEVLISWNNYRVVNCLCCRRTYEYRVRRVRKLDGGKFETPEIVEYKEYF